MSVFRINKTKDYTIMSNTHLKDKAISLKAKGLLSQMLSLPDNWDYSIEGLVSMNKENETSIVSTLGELKENKYLKITKLYPNQTETGRIEYIYDIYEKPQKKKKQEGEKQDLENQGLEFQGLENQGQLNTNILNTNKLNINYNIYIGEIIDYLNLKTKQHYKATTPKTRTLIKARLNEKFTIEDFKKVIDIKTEEWLNNDMAKYLRPETLFGTKFESYLNQKSKLPEWWGKDFKEEVDEYDKLAEQYTRGITKP